MVGQRPLIQALRGVTGPPSGPVPSVDLDAANYSSGTWTDQGTLGFSPSQATAELRPVALADSGFKGKPGVQYSATQNLTGASMPLANSRSKGTLMVAFRSDTSSPPGGAVFSTTQDQISVVAGGRVYVNSADLDFGVLSAGANLGMLSTSGGQLCTLVYDGTQATNSTRLRFWRNRVEEVLAYTAGGVSGAALPATTFSGGTGVFLGREAGGSGWAHVALEILFWRDVALAAGERQAWENYLASKFFTKSGYYLIVSGDSNGQGAPTNTANPWPKRVADARGWPCTNASAVGLKLVDVPSPQSQLRDDWLTAQPYLIALGTNDLAVDHAGLATLQARFNTLKNKSADCRFPVFALTVPEADTVITGADETTRLAYNAWLLTVPGVTVIDVATALGPSGGGNFEGDRLHLSNAGHDTVKAAVLASFSAAGY